MPGKSNGKENATFVFKGTVQETGSATMKQVAANKQTAIVTVDQVIESPKNMAKLGGHRITVQMAGAQPAQKGQQFIFHAHGWIFGDSVAVQSVKQEPLKQTKAHAALLSAGGDPVSRKNDREAEQRFDSAQVVVSGKVTEVRLPPETTGSKGKSAAKSASMTRPVSEHSPHWREAVVEIDDVHKGKPGKKTVVIRFPASTDVRWYKAPKFHPGQQGFFMLHKTQVPAAAAPAAKGKAKAAKPKTIEAYTALHPLDFQPYSDPGGVRKMIDNQKG